MKKLLYFFVSLIPLSAFSLAQDAAPKLETILGNQFALSFLPTYVHDKAKDSDGIAISKRKPDFMPDLWDRIKFTLKYDKVLWHTRVVVANGDHKGGYTLKLDRSYLTYSPIDEVTLEAGMDSLTNTFSGMLSGNNDDITLPLGEGALGGLTSTRNIGVWLFYHPTKDITITPYLLAPKTKFSTDGVQNTLIGPSLDYGSMAIRVPLFTSDSTEHFAASDAKKVPYFGLALEGYFLDKSIYLAGFYETSLLAQHTFFGTANLDKKNDWHTALFLEGSVNLGQFNVARQNSLGLGAGYIGYFGPDNRHELQLEYVVNLENPNADGRLYKTGHNAARTVADTLDQRLKNTYYDLHTLGIGGKFRVYSADQLFFTVGVDVTFAGKRLGSINKDDGTLVAPITVEPTFTIQSSL